MAAVVWVNKVNVLLKVAAALAKETYVAVDTEFMHTRTFFMKLCLLQIRGESGPVYCIDTVKIPRAKLVEILVIPLFYQNRNLLKVMHSCSKDVKVLHELAGCPVGILMGPVFDTAIAWQFLSSETNQIGYANLVYHFTGVSLDKDQTQSNWEARPLTNKQIQYAADDVLFLGDVFLETQMALEEKGLSEWARRLMEMAVAQHSRRLSWSEGVHSVKNVGACVSATQKEKLYFVAAWREKLAAKCNRPRRWVLTDEQVVNVALQVSVCAESNERILFKLQDIGFHPKSPIRNQKDLSGQFELFLESGAVPPYSTWAESMGRSHIEPSGSKKWCNKRQEFLRQSDIQVNAISLEKKISPSLLLTRKDMFLYLRRDPATVAELAKEPRATLIRNVLETADAAFPGPAIRNVEKNK